eukprot:4881697-Pyramimonas_sp.AAC.1
MSRLATSACVLCYAMPLGDMLCYVMLWSCMVCYCLSNRFAHSAGPFLRTGRKCTGGFGEFSEAFGDVLTWSHFGSLGGLLAAS